VERFLGGGWGTAAKAAAVPVGLLLGTGTVGGLVLDGLGIHPGGIRAVLALLLLGIGAGGLEARQRSDGFSLFAPDDYAVHLSGVPYTATALWLLGLWAAARIVRGGLAPRAAAAPDTGPAAHTRAAEAALRTGLLAAAGVLLLALFVGSGSSGEMSFSVSPFGAALAALLVAVPVIALVAGRGELAEWRAAHPGADLLLRAGGTAVRATTAALGLCAVVTLVIVLLALAGAVPELASGQGDADGTLLLFLLPNLAVHLLGLSWGVPVQGEGWAFTRSDTWGGDWSLGMSDFATGWAAGLLALGLICSLLIGVVVARRSAAPREAVLAGGIVWVLFLLLAALGGASCEVTGMSNFSDELLSGVTGTRTLADVRLDLGRQGNMYRLNLT
jgi:hypothetical protein